MILSTTSENKKKRSAAEVAKEAIECYSGDDGDENADLSSIAKRKKKNHYIV